MSDFANALAQRPAFKGDRQPVATHEAIELRQLQAPTAWAPWYVRLALQWVFPGPNNAHGLTGDLQLRRDLRWRQSCLKSVHYSSD